MRTEKNEKYEIELVSRYDIRAFKEIIRLASERYLESDPVQMLWLPLYKRAGMLNGLSADVKAMIDRFVAELGVDLSCLEPETVGPPLLLNDDRRVETLTAEFVTKFCEQYLAEFRDIVRQNTHGLGVNYWFVFYYGKFESLSAMSDHSGIVARYLVQMREIIFLNDIGKLEDQ